MSCGLWGLIQSRPHSRHHLWHARAPCSQPCLLRLHALACDADARSRTPAPSALAERRRILIFNACRCPVQLYTAMAMGRVSVVCVSTRSTLVQRTTRRNLWYVCDRHTAHHVRTQTPQQTPQSRSSDQRPVKTTSIKPRTMRAEPGKACHQKAEPHAADAASWSFRHSRWLNRSQSEGSPKLAKRALHSVRKG